MNITAALLTRAAVTAVLASTLGIGVAHQASAVGGDCSAKRIKVAVSFQPDHAKARATCTSLQSDSRFKAVLTSSVFPDAVSSWRSTKGSVETGTRPYAGSNGAKVEIAKK